MSPEGLGQFVTIDWGLWWWEVVIQTLPRDKVSHYLVWAKYIPVPGCPHFILTGKRTSSETWCSNFSWNTLT